MWDGRKLTRPQVNEVQKCKTEQEARTERAQRSRWHQIIVYPEDQDAENVKSRAAAMWEEWVGILHDKDVDPETGEIKKAHYHLLLHSKNARAPSAVAKALRIPENMVEVMNDGQAALAYLTHSTEGARRAGKWKYPATDLQGPLAEAAAEAAEKATSNASEGAQVLAIIQHIRETPETEALSMSELAAWAAASGLWASFRRAAVIFKTIMEEHNLAAAAERQRRAATVGNSARCTVDPLRFAKLKAGEIAAPEAAVDMAALEGMA